MKPSNIFATLFVAGSTLASVAVAQPAGQAYGSSRPAVVESRREVREDVRDARKLEELKDRYKAARRSMNRFALRSLDGELQRYVAAEIREEERELIENTRGHHTASAFGRNRAVRQDSVALTQLRSLDRELRGLVNRLDGKSLFRKERLIEDLMRLSKRELRQTSYARR